MFSRGGCDGYFVLHLLSIIFLRERLLPVTGSDFTLLPYRFSTLSNARRSKVSRVTQASNDGNQFMYGGHVTQGQGGSQN